MRRYIGFSSSSVLFLFSAVVAILFSNPFLSESSADSKQKNTADEKDDTQKGERELIVQIKGGGLAIRTVERDTVQVDLRSDGLSLSAFTLSEPNRVVVDLLGAESPRLPKISVGDISPYIGKIRVGAHTDRARVVFDLTGELPQILSREDGKAAQLVFSRSLPVIHSEMTQTSPTPSPTIEPPVAAVAPSQVALPSGPQATPKRMIETMTPAPSKTLKAMPENLPLRDLEEDAVVTQAESVLGLDKSEIFFRSDIRPIVDLNVENLGNIPVLVEAIVQEVTRSGGRESRELSKGVLISPKLFELRPGDSRTLRAVLSEQLGHRERSYVVEFLSGSEQQRIHDIELPVFAVPPDASANLKLSRVSGRLLVENAGDLTVEISEVLLRGKRAESVFFPRRLSPAERWVSALPEDARVEVRWSSNGQSRSTLLLPE